MISVVHLFLSLRDKLKKSFILIVIAIAITLTLIIGGITTIFTQSNINRVISEYTLEEDPVRTAIARRKAEIEEIIDNVFTPEDAAPIIFALEGLIISVTTKDIFPQSSYWHNDRRDYMLLKARTFVNSRQFEEAVKVYIDIILLEGEDFSQLSMLYILLADTYRRFGEEKDYKQFRALNLALDYINYASPEISNIEIYTVNTLIALLERKHGWGSGFLLSQ
ncbi:hypothetical protein FWD07_00735 [Candidatus Saccharibacteria bacterium]|nr:hypothetical protein [Candidatus Saccharibacteria bacterium]